MNTVPHAILFYVGNAASFMSGPVQSTTSCIHLLLSRLCERSPGTHIPPSSLFLVHYLSLSRYDTRRAQKSSPLLNVDSKHADPVTSRSRYRRQSPFTFADQHYRVFNVLCGQGAVVVVILLLSTSTVRACARSGPHATSASVLPVIC